MNNNIKIDSLKREVCIIILNWNNSNDTIDCLNSLLKLTFTNYNIIIVENGSKDDSLSRVQDWTLKYDFNALLFDRDNQKISKYKEVINHQTNVGKKNIFIVYYKDNIGFPGGNKVGIEIAEILDPEYVWLLNNDTIVEPSSLKILVDFLDEKKDYVGVSPLIRNYYNQDKIWSSGGTISWFGGLSRNLNIKSKKNIIDNYIDVNFITHCASLYRMDLLKAIPLPEDNWADDDFEYCIRLKKLPYKLACKTNSSILHKIGQTYKLDNNPNYDNISEIGNAYGDYLAHLITIKKYYSFPILFFWMIINSARFMFHVIYKNKKDLITGFVLLFKLLKDSLKFNEFDKTANYHSLNICKK